MKTLEIVTPSLGQFAAELFNAFEQGYKLSDKPQHYPWQDLQYNAILVLGEPVKEEQKPARGRPAKS